MIPENTFTLMLLDYNRSFWILYEIAIELNEKDKIQFLNQITISLWKPDYYEDL